MGVWHDFKTCAPENNEELLLVKYHKAKECIDDYFIYRCGVYWEDAIYLGCSSYYDYTNEACISLESDKVILSENIQIGQMLSDSDRRIKRTLYTTLDTILDRVYWARLSDIENAVERV